MDFNLLLSNVLNPPILFFFLGTLAVFVGSDLEVPQPIPKFLSLYLLMSIGFKGGVELNHSGLTTYVAWSLGAAIFMAAFVPFYSFFVLRRKLDVPNAAAIAATYGSISAVTFIAATSFLSQLKIDYSGHLVAAMALMESPAIIVGVALARKYGGRGESNTESNWRELWRDAFFNGSVFLLIGSLIIGILTGERGKQAIAPFTDTIFKGMLCLFLLDMGLISARRMGYLRKLGAFPIVFAVVVPLINAAIGLLLARVLGMSEGDAFLFCTLCASASYIAVPAAMRLAVPEAVPGVYVSMALALTFPFNIAVGLPFYLFVVKSIWEK